MGFYTMDWILSRLRLLDLDLAFPPRKAGPVPCLERQLPEPLPYASTTLYTCQKVFKGIVIEQWLHSHDEAQEVSQARAKAKDDYHDFDERSLFEILWLAQFFIQEVEHE